MCCDMTKFCSGKEPKALRNARKSGTPSCANPREVTKDGVFKLTFQQDDTGVFAVYKGRRIDPSGYGNDVKPGEVWDCIIEDPMYGERSSFIAMKKVSDAPVTESRHTEEASEPVSEVKPVPKKSRAATPKVDANARKELEKLKKENAALKKRNAVLTEQNKVKKASVTQLEARNRKIRELTEKLESEKKNVKALKAKNSQVRIDSLTSKVGRLQDQLESKELEIVMLREKLRQHGDDDMKVVPRMPNKVFTCLTGPTGIHCSLLTGDRYSVYFNPMKSSIRFVPDTNGDIECVNCMVHIHGLSRFSNFQGLRNLEMKVDGECVEVTL